MSEIDDDGPTMNEPQPSRILVGHDGSVDADQALTMALGLADRLRAPMLIMRAWSIATAPRPPGWEFGYVPSLEELSAAVQDQLVKDTTARVARFPDAPVEYRAVPASPAKCLIESTHGAFMLVVGSRGLGGFAGMLLGSVSEQAVRHAHCPVLVVRRSR